MHCACFPSLLASFLSLPFDSKFPGQGLTVNPDVRPAPGSSMQYMVATAFTHQSIAEFLSGLPNIQQGAVALLTTRAGVPLATSQASPFLNETSIFQSNNTFFKAAAVNLDGLVYNVDSSVD